jgi:hypothetical protein
LMIPVKTQVVLSPLHYHGIDLQVGGLPQKRDVLKKYLFLEILGPRRNHRLFTAQYKWHKIPEGLSGASACFHDGGDPFLKGLLDKKGHLHLRGPELKAIQGSGQQAVLSQDVFYGERRIRHGANIVGEEKSVNAETAMLSDQT